MPEIGEVRKNTNRDNLIWLVCSDCGKGRWVRAGDTRKTNHTGLCQPCCLIRRNGKLDQSPNWKGGVKHCGGYVLIFLIKGNPFYSMVDALGYVKRARLLMAQYLGRVLTDQEEVHHEDEIKDHDHISNLRLFSIKGEHQRYHRLKMETVPRNARGQFIKGGRTNVTN